MTKWVATTQELPGDHQLVIASDGVYCEVCVFRSTGYKRGTFQTHMGQRINATHWSQFDSEIPEQEDFMVIH